MTDHVIGIDLALRNVGVARIDRAGQVRTWVRHTDATDSDHDTAARIQANARWCMGLLTVDTCLVVIEGPSYASEHGQAHERGGQWWAVRRGLAVRQRPDGRPLPVGRVAPSTLKARVAGHGQASKKDMRRAVAKLYPGQGLDRVSFDEADAVGLALLGVIRLRWPDQPYIGAHAPDSAGTWEHLPDPVQPAAARPAPALADPFRAGTS